MNTTPRTSPKHILWWGIGLLILGVLSQVLSTSLSIQASMVSDPIGNPFYYWVFSPVLIIIQNAAFPLGAAFIGASVVIRYLQQSQPTLSQQPEQR
ncbi:hypothetical protein [Enteractinococcus coprophilus]|uniref:Uncharacterized protein n=1 Tax=Enteractinococcus coprophilus TaxID=1027633 RepID=A0A543APB9_9MICC|nr:hypothetical protein [Enteractinococcus coprophilus]TQL74396.1 hypothetical protein FB556_0860 [Enteractinococcus coprophilus]